MCQRSGFPCERRSGPCALQTTATRNLSATLRHRRVRLRSCCLRRVMLGERVEARTCVGRVVTVESTYGVVPARDQRSSQIPHHHDCALAVRRTRHAGRRRRHPGKRGAGEQEQRGDDVGSSVGSPKSRGRRARLAVRGRDARPATPLVSLRIAPRNEPQTITRLFPRNFGDATLAGITPEFCAALPVLSGREYRA